jgi:3-methyl-2-oxobutanoate hydroxymethyltransferase
MSDRKPVTAPDLVRKKARGERIAVVTAYDMPSAFYADQAGVDVLLVGDTVGMTVLGYDTTIPVTLDEMIHHVRAVRRSGAKALVVGDLPFMSYQVSDDEGMRSAGRLIQEGGAQAIKLEGGARYASLVERIVTAGIPVMGHVGLLPQSVNQLGGWRVQGRKPEQAQRVLDDARALETAGAFAVVVEAVPTEVAAAITKQLAVPTIGIGAGPHCDGQVQVFHDLLGLYPHFIAKHARCYLEGGRLIQEALSRYAAEVRSGAFPGDENTFHQPDLGDPATWSS